MNAPDPVDTYIARSAAFARPILEHVRALYHRACPDIEETIKWGMPHFEYKGLVGGMAAFKNHVSIGFWKAALLKDAHGLFEEGGGTQMAAIKARSVDELPRDEILLEYIAEGIALNEKGVKAPVPKREKRVLTVPPDLAAALEANPEAAKTFEAFSYTNRKEYIEWLTEAKREETRARRLAQAVEWMAEGKERNWKYRKR